MSTIEKIKQQRVSARTEPARAVEFSILTLLVGELETATKRDGSEITDEKVISAARKMIKSNEQTVEIIVRKNAETKAKVEAGTISPDSEEAEIVDLGKLVQENAVLSAFLPTVWDEATMLGHIKESGATDIGGVMRHLKQFSGQYEPAMASRLAKVFLAS
ncbi:hypothetical protein RYA05_00730 [Pseudomonas syringae pv. actinidiae]|nr:hypothetical protein [Pseudomonas syringae pv. actinidiae]